MHPNKSEQNERKSVFETHPPSAHFLQVLPLFFLDTSRRSTATLLPQPFGTQTPPMQPLKDSIDAALKSLDSQTARLEQFHTQSLGWHQQHNETLAAIADVLARLTAEANDDPTPPQQPPSSTLPPPAPAQAPPLAASQGVPVPAAAAAADVADATLLQDVRRCLRLGTGGGSELRALLGGMGLSRWRTLGPDGFVLLLPVLGGWLRDPQVSQRALAMLYEGTKLWSAILSRAEAAQAVSGVVANLRALARHGAAHTRDDASDLLAAIEEVCPQAGMAPAASGGSDALFRSP